MESSCEFGIEPSGFHKMLGNYRVASQLVASRVVLSSTEFSYSSLLLHILRLFLFRRLIVQQAN
jgi:uncharacterized protein (UPF0262 family)